MAFPNILQLQYGDEKVTGLTKIYPLGQRAETPDGKAYRYARASATAIVAGKLYQGKAGEANTAQINDLAPAGTVSAGDRTLDVTIAGTALGSDVFNDGTLFVASSVGTGIGHTYKVKSASSAAAGSTSTVTLEGNEQITVALESGTTTVGLRKNKYDEVLLSTANTVRVNALAGVSAASAAASAYVWLQTRGEAAVFTDNTTLIIGLPCTASTTVAGAVGGNSAATTLNSNAIGYTKVGQVVSVAGSAEYSLIDLSIE